MSRYAALVRRELAVYFVSPMAYLILTAFLFLNGVFFYLLMDWFAASRTAVSFGMVQLVMVNMLTLATPLVTMRLVAEEKNRGTLETMMTAPISEWQFILAKFSAAFLFISYLLLPTVCYAVLAARYGTVDIGAACAGYVGILLAVSAVLAIGLFISAMTTSQITAGVLTLIAALLLMLLPQIAPRLPEGESGIHVRIPGIMDFGDLMTLLRGALEHINLLGHMEAFSRGLVDSRSAVYLISVTGTFLFMAVRVVESRRWR